MKFEIKREIRKIEIRIVEGDFTVSKTTVRRIRKNQAGGFQNCDHCLKRIDQDGETMLLVISTDDPSFFYTFHESCFEEKLC